ncbi:MAG: energy transducer TonB, partial [Daejeonella sp.]|nr:energy transducer TonB [Daejeonella sp.]
MVQYPEENNYPKALLFSSVVMGLFLLISYYIIITKPFTPEEEIGTGGIIVNYGTSDTGMGDDYMSVEEPSVA